MTVHPEIAQAAITTEIDPVEAYAGSSATTKVRAADDQRHPFPRQGAAFGRLPPAASWPPEVQKWNCSCTVSCLDAGGDDRPLNSATLYAFAGERLARQIVRNSANRPLPLENRLILAVPLMHQGV